MAGALYYPYNQWLALEIDRLFVTRPGFYTPTLVRKTNFRALPKTKLDMVDNDFRTNGRDGGYWPHLSEQRPEVYNVNNRLNMNWPGLQSQRPEAFLSNGRGYDYYPENERQYQKIVASFIKKINCMEGRESRNDDGSPNGNNSKIIRSDMYHSNTIDSMYWPHLDSELGERFGSNNINPNHWPHRDSQHVGVLLITGNDSKSMPVLLNSEVSPSKSINSNNFPVPQCSELSHSIGNDSLYSPVPLSSEVSRSKANEPLFYQFPRCSELPPSSGENDRKSSPVSSPVERFRSNMSDSKQWPPLNHSEMKRSSGSDGENTPRPDVVVFGSPRGGARREQKRTPVATRLMCTFCKNNGECAQFYEQHVLKDGDGIVTCPILRNYVCPICGETGDSAHTVRYCPQNPCPPDVAIMNVMREYRSSTGNLRYRKRSE